MLTGNAIITTNKAALWTDGRYFLQANNQLDENWTLMKQGRNTDCTNRYELISIRKRLCCRKLSRCIQEIDVALKINV